MLARQAAMCVSLACLTGARQAWSWALAMQWSPFSKSSKSQSVAACVRDGA